MQLSSEGIITSTKLYLTRSDTSYPEPSLNYTNYTREESMIHYAPDRLPMSKSFHLLLRDRIPRSLVSTTGSAMTEAGPTLPHGIPRISKVTFISTRRSPQSNAGAGKNSGAIDPLLWYPLFPSIEERILTDESWSNNRNNLDQCELTYYADTPCRKWPATNAGRRFPRCQSSKTYSVDAKIIGRTSMSEMITCFPPLNEPTRLGP